MNKRVKKTLALLLAVLLIPVVSWKPEGFMAAPSVTETPAPTDAALPTETPAPNDTPADLEGLKNKLEPLLEGFVGNWSVYVKNLTTEEELLLNDRSTYSASLAKVFVMMRTYQEEDSVRANEAKLLETDPRSSTVWEVLYDLMWKMITVSDNESYNELVRLQSAEHDFLDGAVNMDRFLHQEGFIGTTIQTTLHPSESELLTLGGRNMTSVSDCGRFLDLLYKGECVSEEASEEMLDMLLHQEETWKIPAGLPPGTRCANKAGETDKAQHDIAIVYGEKTDYILCVMSDNCKSEDDGIEGVQRISGLVYDYLNR